MVKDINPKAASGDPLHITVSGNRRFFSADDGEHGDESRKMSPSEDG